MADEIILCSIEEANALLPRVHEALADLRAMQTRMEQIRDKQEVLHLIHGGKITDESNPDHGEWSTLATATDAVASEFNEYVTAVHKTGIVLKDLEQGLVDFYHDRGGEIVFLCWREGEDCVEFWHPLQTGFAGRQPLDIAE